MSTSKRSEPSLERETKAFAPPWPWAACQAEGRGPSTAPGLPGDTGREPEHDGAWELGAAPR